MPHDVTPAGHDKLSSRLSQILLRLNQGQCLRPQALARESGVSLGSEQPFERQPQFEQQLREQDSIWLKRQKTDVVLQIAKPAAGYFHHRKLIAGSSCD